MIIVMAQISNKVCDSWFVKKLMVLRLDVSLRSLEKVKTNLNHDLRVIRDRSLKTGLSVNTLPIYFSFSISKNYTKMVLEVENNDGKFRDCQNLHTIHKKFPKFYCEPQEMSFFNEISNANTQSFTPILSAIESYIYVTNYYLSIEKRISLLTSNNTNMKNLKNFLVKVNNLSCFNIKNIEIKFFMEFNIIVF